MKTKYVILTIVFVVIIAGGIWLFSTAQNIKKIQVSVGEVKFNDKIGDILKDFQIKKLADISNFLTEARQIDLRVDTIINNFGNKDFTLTQIYLEIWNEKKDNRIAYVSQPITPTRLNKGTQVKIPVDLKINSLPAIKYILESDFLSKGFVIKGYVRLQNAILQKRFEQKVNIEDLLF